MQKQNIRCELISWNHFYRLCRQLVSNIYSSGFVPDVIIAIERGGYMPARILSDHLKIANLTSFKIEHYQGTKKEPVAKVRYPLSTKVVGQRVLLVDDVSDTGDTFKVAVEHIREIIHPLEIKSAALHHKTVSSFQPDYYAKKVVQWRWIIYPWALVEDISGFVEAMTPPPKNSEEIIIRLQREHGIRIPASTIQDVLTCNSRLMLMQ